jgi:hypothetical protein
MNTIPHAEKSSQDDSEERSPTEQAGDIVYFAIYRGERLIPDEAIADLSRFAPHHEVLSHILFAFDAAGEGAQGAQAAEEVWRGLRRQDAELAQ